MHFSGIVGCGLLLYAPLFFASAAALAVHPQLLLVALSAAFVAFIGLFLTALFYLLLQQSAPASLFVVFYVVVTGVLRVLLFFGLYRGECAARRYGQLFVASSIRFALVAAAVGCGFGAVSTLRGAGTLLDATRRLSFYTEGTTAYNLNACPRLPLLVHSAIQAFLMFCAQVAWAVMTGQAVAALQRAQHSWRECLLCDCDCAPDASGVIVEGPEFSQGLPRTPGLAGPSRNSGTAERLSSSFVPCATKHVETSIEHACERGHHAGREEAEEAEGAENRPHSPAPGAGDGTITGGNGGGRPLLAPQNNHESWLSQPTLLYRAPFLAVLSLIAVFALHLLFSLASVLNTGAYDDVAQEEIPWRGCVASLPIQAAVTVVSLLWMAGILHMERRE